MRRNRVLGTTLLAVLAVAGLSAGQVVPGTYAAPAFRAQAVSAANRLTSAILTPPGALQEAVDTGVTPYQVALSWSPAGIGNGYEIDRGDDSSGTCGSFVAVGTSVAPSFVDTTAASNYSYCYQIMTRLQSGGSIWTSSFVVDPQLSVYTGLIAESWGWTNAGSALTIDAGDTLTITFNTLVDSSLLSTGRANLCARGSGRLDLWERSARGSCRAGQLGYVTGASFSGTGRVSESNTDWVWSTITVDGVAKSTVTLTVTTNSGVTYSSSGQNQVLKLSRGGRVRSLNGSLLPTVSCPNCTPASTTNP
ncbi:MAG TPA: hypothetical protein VMU49_04290 [Candidatus Acidoferrales bacterium]|nr:hypothetical protein [Candidatus Acidoferrales bacterium]